MYLQVCNSMTSHRKLQKAAKFLEIKGFQSLHKTIFVLIQWITGPQGKPASVAKQAYMNSWPRQQRSAVLSPGPWSQLPVLSSAQAILTSPFSSTFIVPSFHYKQSHTICTHKPLLQLFRLKPHKTHDNSVQPFYQKWQRHSESVALGGRGKKAQSTICWKILLFDHVYNWSEWKQGETKRGCEGMRWHTCNPAPNLKPNWRGWQDRHGGTRQNHDVQESLTNGTTKTYEDRPYAINWRKTI